MFAILMAAFVFIKIRVSEWNLETTMKVNLRLNLSNLITLPQRNCWEINLEESLESHVS